MKVSEWERILVQGADAVPALKGRTADAMAFMIKTELYITLGLTPDQHIVVPMAKPETGAVPNP